MTSNAARGASGTPRITVGDLVVDRERFRVTIGGEAAPLTYLEFEALYVLAGAKGRVVAYDAIANALWGADRQDHRRRLAVLVSRIRAKLGSHAHYVQTVRRVGYRLAANTS